VPAVVTRTRRRRQFSEEDKRLIVEETCQPGQCAQQGDRIGADQGNSAVIKEFRARPLFLGDSPS
jgi:hypothetical protein